MIGYPRRGVPLPECDRQRIITAYLAKEKPEAIARRYRRSLSTVRKCINAYKAQQEAAKCQQTS